MKRLITVTLCFVLVATGIALAEHQPFDLLTEAALSYFTPMKGSVLSAQGDRITSDLASQDDLKPGMRLRVLRGGEAFVHPITGERVGQAEEPIGIAEAVEVSETGSSLRVLSGEAGAGDILRISSAPVPLLFFQEKNVQWGFAEEYFNHLKDTERFELIETAPGEAVDGSVLADARRLGAEAALLLTASGTVAKPVLKQRILWVEGSSELMASEVLVSEGIAHQTRLGEEYFTPDLNRSTLEFTLPYTAILMTVGDLNGDGEEEIVFSSGSILRAYTIGATLAPALKGIELRTSMSRTHLWLEAFDLDGDGRDELVITATGGQDAQSYIYRYEGEEFKLLWEDDIFVRVIAGTLYGQRSAQGGGFNGKVFPVQWQEDIGETNNKLTLPKGINLYDFQQVTLPGGAWGFVAFDAKRHLSMYMSDGTAVWRSNETYGWPLKTFGGHETTEPFDSEPWSVGDRMLSVGIGTFTMKHTPVSPSTPGLGNSSSQVVAVYPEDSGAQEAVIVDSLPGGTADIAILDNQLLVLVNTKSINPMKLIKGRGLFDTKLYIHMLRKE